MPWSYPRVTSAQEFTDDEQVLSDRKEAGYELEGSVLDQQLQKQGQAHSVRQSTTVRWAVNRPVTTLVPGEEPDPGKVARD